MSTYGGDSWAREAHHRKRRVDDLMLFPSSSSSSRDASFPSFKKLSNGKYACLVCPHNPILDTPLMLSVHNKGSRHIAAESRVRASELSKRNELHKRIALSEDSTGLSSSDILVQQGKSSGFHNKPLIQKTMKAILETKSNQMENPKFVVAGHKTELGTRSSVCDSKHSPATDGIREPSGNDACEFSNSNEKKLLMTAATNKMLTDWHSEFSECREKELKFTSAGWKRDCHGKWYRDENVEFDSDEEDPNITLR
ncbi:uncharacterized protein LOC103969169 [Musa acuminata AAA Group]|uniref:uncharacterized protein LOC103969169 n=1 Tax=Musa acuminata AAA Group TaxID=214697 RepID=UPI0031D81729